MTKDSFCFRWGLLYTLFFGFYFLSAIKAAAQNEARAKNCDCWIDAKTGKKVNTAPLSGANISTAATINGAGSAIVDDNNYSRAYNPKTGQNFVRLSNGCWIDAKTGKEVPTAPLSGVNISTAATIQGAGSAVIDDFNSSRAYNPKTGQNFVRVPCDSINDNQTSPKQNTQSNTQTVGGYHYSPIIDMITIQAGVVFTTLYGIGQQGAQFAPAFFFGAGLRLPVETRFYINPSIKFAQAGSNYKQGDKYKLSYIDVDADAEFDWCDPDMYGEIGVKGRMNTSADLKYNGSSYNEKKYFKSADAGINAQLGWKATRKFAVSINFYLGLVNTYNTTNTTGTGKNMSIGIGGRYCLN